MTSNFHHGHTSSQMKHIARQVLCQLRLEGHLQGGSEIAVYPNQVEQAPPAKTEQGVHNQPDNHARTDDETDVSFQDFLNRGWVEARESTKYKKEAENRKSDTNNAKVWTDPVQNSVRLAVDKVFDLKQAGVRLLKQLPVDGNKVRDDSNNQE